MPIAASERVGECLQSERKSDCLATGRTTPKRVLSDGHLRSDNTIVAGAGDRPFYVK